MLPTSGGTKYVLQIIADCAWALTSIELSKVWKRLQAFMSCQRTALKTRYCDSRSLVS